MEATKTYEEALSIEALRAMIQDLAVQQKENERQMKASSKRLDKKLSKLGDRFGEMIEHMVRPNLLRRFRELGFDFDIIRPAPWHARVEDRILTEVDVYLENKETAMIVEIRSKPSTDDIKEHMERMKKLRIWADANNDKRKYVGAIGGMIMNNNERDFALKSGFYVIEPSRGTFAVIAPEGDYAPREW